MTAGIRTYDVRGISCDHCKRAIEEHVRLVDGVETVTVDVDGGDPSAVEAAVADAGYTIA